MPLPPRDAAGDRSMMAAVPPLASSARGSLGLHRGGSEQGRGYLKRSSAGHPLHRGAADEAPAAVEAASAVIAATERTALLVDRARSSTRRADEKRRVRLDASLIDVSTKDDDNQAQIAILHPVL